MNWMLKNSAGKLDSMLTFAAVAFFICMTKFALSGLTFAYGETNINFDVLDPALVGAILAPTLGAYVMRRHTDRKFLFGIHTSEAQTENDVEDKE